jgi:2-dehydropantoate 2-reductase
MKLVVLGTGAVGAYYGGLLARAGHDGSCFARAATLAAIGQRGLEIRTPESTFQAHVEEVRSSPRANRRRSSPLALLAR